MTVTSFSASRDGSLKDVDRGSGYTPIGGRRIMRTARRSGSLADLIVVFEAMRMEQPLNAHKGGVRLPTLRERLTVAVVQFGEAATAG